VSRERIRQLEAEALGKLQRSRQFMRLEAEIGE
jgi:DNA-directed RNA polymerase sigma subunit (sigma70/sigma32)